MNVLQEITVPLLSVNDQSLTIVELSFKAGAPVKKGDTVTVLETSKTTYTVEAEADGYISYFCKAGDELPVNEVIARIYDEQPDPAIVNTPSKETASPKKGVENKVNGRQVKQTIFSNSAIELLSQYKLDKQSFAGWDFVSGDDVLRQLNLPTKKTPQIATGEPAEKLNKPLPAPDLNSDKFTITKLSSNKRREIEYLTSVQSSGLVSIINAVIDVETVMPFLQSKMAYFKDSLLPVLIYETGKLLKKYPVFNGYYYDGSIISYLDVNIGFAIDIDKGLKVVKIAETNKKQVKEIEEAIVRLSGAYLDEKLSIDDLSDITFTITDLSNEKVASFQPLINMKNAAILGVSAIDKKLQRCTLSLAFDHRVTEGKAAAVFLSELKQRIESFTSLSTQEEIQAQKLKAVSCHRCHKTLLEDTGNVGFAQCITADGTQDYICQACFKGF